MGDRRPQNFANHRRLVPGYHFAVFGALVAGLVYALVQLFRVPSFATAFATLLALALLGMFFYVRIFALAVQDRIIRLEMRLRLKEILPPDLKARIGELDKDQLIGLRFAGDAEIADLMREVLTNGIHDRDEIKRRVKDWQADYWRC